MTPLQYFKSIWDTLPALSQQTGYSRFYLARTFTRQYLAHRVQIDEFRTLHLYDYTPQKVDRFLLWRRCVKNSDILNAEATPADIAQFNDKHLFNQAFQPYIHRDWLYVPDSKLEDIRRFAASHDVFLVKACTSTQGKGIEKFESAGLDIERFLQDYREKPVLLESFLVQHPVLAAVNPSSVNTIRLITAKKGDRVQLIGAGLRCGGSDQFVDNFHHGGAAYPIDLETGIITGPGTDLDGNPIFRHPTTGHVMPGLQLPHWDMVLSQIPAIARVSEHIGYVGWDIAITPQGIELIEGNINYPGTFIIQLDGTGAYQRLMELMNTP
jgi:AraC-like DNA-binding protein